MAEDSFKIIDDVLTPNDKLIIEYKGPNPFRVYGIMAKTLQIIFHGRGKNVFEESFKWDITGDPRDFYFKFSWGDDRLDKYTRPYVYIVAIGKQPSDPNSPNGALYMEIKARLETTFDFGNKASEEYLNPLEKAFASSFIWLYSRLIYASVRRRYLQIMKERVYKLSAAIRKELGVTLEQPELSGADVRVSKLPV